MTTTQPTPSSTADLIDKAADHMARVGQHKGCLYDHSQVVYGRVSYSDCRVDIGGALSFVVFGKPYHDHDPADVREPLFDAAVRALAGRLGCTPLYLCDWNDRHSQEQVIALMREVSDSLRSERIPA